MGINVTSIRSISIKDFGEAYPYDFVKKEGTIFSK